jgi:hypothetical protein
MSRQQSGLRNTVGYMLTNIDNQTTDGEEKSKPEVIKLGLDLPCGYWYHRELTKRGAVNYVVAPQLLENQRTKRQKPDRLDDDPC